MKKVNIYLLCALLVSGVVSFSLLQFCFDSLLEDNLRLLVQTIFTGSIIAIPSAFVVLISSLKENRNDLNYLLVEAQCLIISSLKRLEIMSVDDFLESNETEKERQAFSII